MNGTEWTVEQVSRVVDGDTVHLIRSRTVALDGRRYSLSDVESAAIRLVWVDTPERGHPGWHEARADLAEWCRRVPLRVICYESAGWDRLLGDLIDADGNSASQWLMIEKGWPPYVG